MAHTNLVLGTNWSKDEWPDSVDVMHEDARDSRRYVPKKTTRLVWSKHRECWKCESCGNDFGDKYFSKYCIPCGWNYCSNCGAKITEVVSNAD